MNSCLIQLGPVEKPRAHSPVGGAALNKPINNYHVTGCTFFFTALFLAFFRVSSCFRTRMKNKGKNSGTCSRVSHIIKLSHSECQSNIDVSIRNDSGVQRLTTVCCIQLSCKLVHNISILIKFCFRLVCRILCEFTNSLTLLLITRTKYMVC